MMIGLTLIQKYDPLFQKVCGSVQITPFGEAKSLEEHELYQRASHYLGYQLLIKGLLPNQLIYPIYFDENNQKAINRPVKKENSKITFMKMTKKQ